jgi:predicted nucleotidyltransferase
MGMRNVRVFGSVLHGDDREGSDIDLLVDVPDGATLLDMVALERAIEAEIGISVDVLTADDLPTRFRNIVLSEARPL